MKRFTPKHKLNLSRALKGKRKSLATREKIALTMRGRKLSRKTVLRMRMRENRKQEAYQKIMKHYLTKHETSPKLDRRKLYSQCHVCGEEIR